MANASLLDAGVQGWGTERLVIYCQTTGVSAAHATHCATYCTPCRPLIRAFSGWIRTPPPNLFSFCFCPIAPPLPLVLPLPATLLVRFSYPSATSSREGMIGPGAMRILPSFPPLHLLLPLPPPQPLLPPRLPLTTLLPSLSRPVLEQSGAPPLVRRVRSGASRRSPPTRSAGASRRPMHPFPRLAPSTAAPPHHFPALHCSPAPALAAVRPPSSVGRSLPLSSPFPPSRSAAPQWHAHPASCSAPPCAPLSSSPPPTTRPPPPGGQVKSGTWARFCLSSKNRFEKTHPLYSSS
jgi:hypothetical protein